MESLVAHLLISSAGLHDPNFRHTVVLIAAHDHEGAVGVVINRSTEFRVADAVPPLARITGSEALLFEGGPVQPMQPVLLAELEESARADLQVLGNIGFITGDVDDALRPSILRARVYAGYSGWGAGQLEGELEEGAWIVEPALPEDIFTDEPRSLWKRVLERKGGPYRRIAMVPKDPRVN
jgi:putative transcriptional regulator